jgi:hypothetical protein
MAVAVTIDSASRADAELIAAALPGGPEAKSWRGYGVIRLRFKSEREARETIPLVAACVEHHALAWARVRIGDDEQMFRTRRRAAQRAAGSEARSTSATA